MDLASSSPGKAFTRAKPSVLSVFGLVEVASDVACVLCGGEASEPLQALVCTRAFLGNEPAATH